MSGCGHDHVDGKDMDGACSSPASEIPTSPTPRDESDGFFSSKKRSSGRDATDMTPGGPDLRSGLKMVSEYFVPQQPQNSDISNTIPENRYEYDMSKNKTAFVFVNQHFDPKTEQKNRNGAENDLIYFNKAFKHLGFNVKALVDGTTNAIWETFLNYAKASHEDESCVAFAFSTHGDEELLDKKKREFRKYTGDYELPFTQGMEKNVETDVIYAKDGTIFSRDLMATVSNDNCRSMANKPKLFFFQACRGSMLDEVIATDSDNNVVSYRPPSDPAKQSIIDNPLNKDFFIAYSAPPGFYSWRRSKSHNKEDIGSWFVLAFHKAVLEHGLVLELLDIMTIVSDLMAHDPQYTSSVKNALFHERKVVPFMTSMLVKSIKFRKE